MTNSTAVARSVLIEPESSDPPAKVWRALTEGTRDGGDSSANWNKRSQSSTERIGGCAWT
jgi:hypothetical protein